MNKEYLIQFFSNGNSDIRSFLYEYCIYKGKSPQMTEAFLNVAIMMGMLPSLFQYAMEVMCQEFSIGFVRDVSTNQILKAYDFERNEVAGTEKHGEDPPAPAEGSGL